MTLHEFKTKAQEIIGEPFYDASVGIDNRDRVEWRVTWAGMNIAKAGTPEQALVAIDAMFSGDRPTRPEQVEV